MTTQSNWRDLRDTFPWVKAFNDTIRTLPLPIFQGKEIIIGTDSSGSHQQNPFEVFGIVIFDLDSSHRWEVLRQEIRRELLTDSRRMAFKKLGDKIRQRALEPFLLAADQMNGLCLSVAVNKQINLLGGGTEVHDQLKRDGKLKAQWTPDSFARMARVTQFVSLMVAGLCSEGQNVYWISDEDEMFESPIKTGDTLQLLSAFRHMFIKWPLGKFSAGTTKLDNGDRFEEDFAAIADLAAGALGELVMKIQKDCGGCLLEANIELPLSLSNKSDVLLQWLMDTSKSLKRASLIFDQRLDGKFRVGKFWSEDSLLKCGAI